MPAVLEDVLGSTTGGGTRSPLGWAAELRGFLTSHLIMFVYSTADRQILDPPVIFVIQMSSLFSDSKIIINLK